MNKYSFMLFFKSSKETAFIDCEAEDWRKPVASEKIVNIFAEPLIKGYLASAFIGRGYLFNPKKHSPCQLYQALLNNSAWEVTVDGDNLPEPLLCPDDLPTDSE